MKKIVFLDLEDTVIDEFNAAAHAGLMNIERVRAFLAEEAPDEVRLFSFAIWDEHRVALFHEFFEARLNRELGVTLDLVDTFTTEKLFHLCGSKGVIFENDNECMLFHGKAFGFQHFIEMSPEFDHTEVVLVDDAVEAKWIHYPGRKLTLRMLNVLELPEPG